MTAMNSYGVVELKHLQREMKASVTDVEPGGPNEHPAKEHSRS